MNILDLAFIAFLLVLTAVGIYKGFIKTAFGLLAGIVSFAVAALFSKPLASLLSGLKLFDPAKLKLEGYLLEKASGAGDNVNSVVEGLGLPGFINNLLFKDFSDKSALFLEDSAKSLGDTLFTFILLAVVFIVLVIGIRLLMIFLGKTFDKIAKKVKLLNTTNKLLGGFFGLINALFITFLVLAVITLLASQMPGTVESVNKTSLVSYLYENNILLKLISR